MAKYLKEFWLLSILNQYNDKQFFEQTRCITGLFERHFIKLEIPEKSWRLLVTIVDNLRGKEIVCGETINVQIIGDVKPFYTSLTEQKKIMSLEMLKQGYDRVIELLGYPRENFDKAYQAVIDANYVNNWIWKRKFSSDRKYIAEIFCEHEVEYFRLSVLLRENNIIVDHVHLADVSPSDFAFVQYLGELKWLATDKIEYASGDRNNIWTYDLNSKNIDFQGPPIPDYKKRWKH